MKLHRFIALDTQRAMLMVHKKMGADALIYSTRRVANGIEILAGTSMLENEIPVELEKPNFDKEMIDKLNIQLQVMEESIQKLTNHIITLYQVVSENAKPKPRRKINWQAFNILSRLKKQFIEGRYGRQTVHF